MRGRTRRCLFKGVIMERSEIQRDLVDFVVRNFLVDESEIVLGESLVDQGIIDSFGLVEIAAFIKKKYTVKTDEQEMNRENFGSLLKMAAYVERKQHG
jgi:acyl carrier protein